MLQYHKCNVPHRANRRQQPGRGGVRPSRHVMRVIVYSNRSPLEAPCPSLWLHAEAQQASARAPGGTACHNSHTQVSAVAYLDSSKKQPAALSRVGSPACKQHIAPQSRCARCAAPAQAVASRTKKRTTSLSAGHPIATRRSAHTGQRGQSQHKPRATPSFMPTSQTVYNAAGPTC